MIYNLRCYVDAMNIINMLYYGLDWRATGGRNITGGCGAPLGPPLICSTHPPAHVDSPLLWWLWILPYITIVRLLFQMPVKNNRLFVNTSRYSQTVCEYDLKRLIHVHRSL